MTTCVMKFTFPLCQNVKKNYASQKPNPKFAEQEEDNLTNFTVFITISQAQLALTWEAWRSNILKIFKNNTTNMCNAIIIPQLKLICSNYLIYIRIIL